MKSKTILDQAITASSIFDQNHGPERTRLDIVKEGLFSGGWKPSYLNLGQWIQVDLTNITKITGVATQGLQELDNWVTKYSITFSVDEGPFLSYNENQILLGNVNRDTVIGHILDPPIIARYIRLHPVEFNGYIAMRVELYGCKYGFSFPEVPPCQIQLGMQNGTIPDSSITASSSLSANDGPQNARLHHQIGGLLYGAWRPLFNNADQWLKVDFSVEKQVTVVATQGREEGLFWVKTCLLSYSSDGMNYTMYEQDGGAKIFTGNTDGFSVATNVLDPPIRLQYLKFHPQTWNNQIALRAEVYGC